MAKDVVISLQLVIFSATEEMIEDLSPAAATVSKLLKKGMSLTQIYTDFVKCQEELIGTRLEKEKLEATLTQVRVWQGLFAF